MKRKVKFQEGGAVEGESARRPARESARNRQLREMMERRGREGRRVRTSERLQEEATTRRGAARGAGAPDFTTSPEGTTRRGTGREMVPYREPGAPTTRGGREMAPYREPVPAREVVPATQGGREVGPTRPSASRALAEVATPRQMPLGRVRLPIGGGLAGVAGALAAEAVGPLVNYGREYAARRGAEADARREENLQAFRNQELDRMRADLPAGPDIPTEMRNAMPARPDAAAERRAARPAPAPAPRRELTMEEIRALRSGERAPRTREERALLEGLRDLPVMSEADRLNEREFQRARAARAAEEAAALQMTAPVDVGAASARARGEQVGPPGDYNMKKGGIVKKKAGGMIAAKPKSAPKKMMKGGMVAKPKIAAKSKAKPMPFKKGGVIKKGKK